MATLIEDEALSNLTRAQAALFLNKADQSQVRLVRRLVKEALFVMDLHHWPGNRDDCANVLGALRPRLEHPLLIPKDVAQGLLEHAEKVAAQPRTMPKETTGFDSFAFDRVREMIEPYLDALPSLGDSENILFQHPPEIYLPLLRLEMRDTRGYQNWAAIRIAAKGEYGRVVLSEIEPTLRDVRYTGYEHSQCVEVGRLALGADFDRWYEGIRGRSLAEDIDLMQANFNKRFRDDATD